MSFILKYKLPHTRALRTFNARAMLPLQYLIHSSSTFT